MSFHKSLPEDAVLLDIFKAYPATSIPLLEYHEALLRGPSPLSVGERELIAAYCSALNRCHYCEGVHTRAAERLGVAEGLVARLVDDVEGAPVGERLKPILRFARKLTLEPHAVGPADAEAIFAAGWDEKALHDAASVCALFNLMNRFVVGQGVDAGDDYFALAGKRVTEQGYAGLIKLLERHLERAAG